MIDTQFAQVLPPEEHYCIPKLNEIRFVGHRQTLSLVLGSCISTVFVGGSGPFVIAANHIVIANPREGSIVATKSAQEQIDEIVDVYDKAFGIGRNDICCLHLIGAGSKSGKKEFRVPEQNIREVKKILGDNSFNVMFSDTGSFFFATYSLYRENLAVFIENKIKKEHISFTIDLGRLIKHGACNSALMPASSLVRSDPGFEYLVSEGIISLVIGSRDRITEA